MLGHELIMCVCLFAFLLCVGRGKKGKRYQRISIEYILYIFARVRKSVQKKEKDREEGVGRTHAGFLFFVCLFGRERKKEKIGA